MQLLVSADYPPIPGGLTTVTLWAANVLAREHGVALATYRPRGWLDEPPGVFSCPVFRAPGFERGVLRVASLCRHTRAWLGERRPPVEHVTAINLVDGGILGWWWQRRFNIPYTLCAFGYDFLKFRHNPLAHRIALQLYAGARRVIAISRYTREALIDFGVAADKIDLCTFGFNVERFTPCAPAERNALRGRFQLPPGPVLFSVGRLIPRKGHDRVLHALAQLKNDVPGLYYVIGGNGPHKPVLQQLTRDLGLDEHVRFAGFIPDAELPAWYNTADLVIQPNRKEGDSVEGLGLIFWEAGACGVPVIGGRSGGTVDAIEHDATGFLVDPDDQDDITHHLRLLLTDADLRQRLGQHAASRIPQRCEQAATDFLASVRVPCHAQRA